MVASGLVIVWLIGLIRIGWIRRKAIRPSGRRAFQVDWRFWHAVYCGLGLVWMVGLVGLLVGVDNWRFTYGVPWWLRVWLALPLLAMLAFLVASSKRLRAFRESRQSSHWFWVVDGLVLLVWLAELAHWHLWPWA